MTLTTEIAAFSGFTNTTDIGNAITEAASQLSLYYDGGDLAEGTDTDWDKIIKFVAVRILKIQLLTRQAMTNPNISIPEVINSDVNKMIEIAKTKVLQDDTPEASIVAIISTPSENWYSPSTSRGSEI